MQYATRFILALSAMILVGGCSATPATPKAELASAEFKAAPQDVTPQARPAGALAFGSGLPPAYPLAGLDRNAREPGAFFGYESTITESYVLYTDDDQHHYGGGFGRGGWGGGFGAGWGDDYERRAVSVKTGVIER